MNNKIKFIDLFAGCGGLLDGFMQSGYYEPIASVEWEKAPVIALKNRLKNHWGIQNVDEEVIRFDIQREEELFNGFNDSEYGSHCGLDKLVNEQQGVDIIIGGPPCQAYSVAGRNANRMDSDYRNYLFEHYIAVINRYKPKLFVFENVPGMLSAVPNGTLITDLIKRDLQKIGYEIIGDIKNNALIDTSEFGVPQSRKRVILIGIRSESFENPQNILRTFYQNILPKYKCDKIYTLYDAIGDLPALYPVKPYKKGNRSISHEAEKEANMSWHVGRYQNDRDVNVFRLLTEDIENQENKYTDTTNLIKLYEETTGKKTAVHKYHVLRKDEPSTTILAHLHKDGFRFIHYDSKQARTITVREAARIQTFDDDFEFSDAMGASYKMIGNAVPPLFAKKLAEAIKELMELFDFGGE